MAKHVKKLGLEIVGTVVKIKELMTGKEMEFDFAKLPKEIQAKLGPHGLKQKLGDSAAGDQGQEAVDSIMHVWEGLMAGNWAVRSARGESVSVSAVEQAIAALPAGEQVKARQTMLRLKALKPKTDEDFAFMLAQKLMTADEIKAAKEAIAAKAAPAAK